MYTLLALLVTIAALSWHSLLRRSSWRAWIALWISELALLYSHNTGPVIVVWLNAITILAWIMNRLSPVGTRYIMSLPNTRRWVLFWFAGQIGVALLWSPYFVTRFLLLPEANKAVSNISPMNFDLLSRMWQAVWTGPWLMVGQEPLIVALSAVIFILALLLIPWRSANARWLVLHVFLLTGGVWAGLALLGNEIHGRYLVMITPLLLTALAAGIAKLPDFRRGGSQTLTLRHLIYPIIALLTLTTGGVWAGLALLGNEIHGRYLVMIASLLLIALGAGLARLSDFRRGGSQTLPLRYIVYPIVALFTLTFLAAIHFATTNPAYQHDDARGMVQYYADHLTENDTVLDWSYADRYELGYYWDKLGVKAKRVTLPEGADLDTVLPLLPTSGDVALNVWYTQRADYRGMMSCVLGNGTINTPDQFTVYGMSDLLYRAPSLDLPDLKPANISVGDIAQITAIGGIQDSTADQALCLPIQLTLKQKMDVDLKVVVIVKNLEGEVARADAIFADAAQQTTSQLNPGDIVTAYPLLRLPYGASVGQYWVVLTVYDEQKQLSGYTLTDYDLSSSFQTPVFPLITPWNVNPGADWEKVNRTSDLPVTVDIPVSNDLTLIGHNATGGTFRNGDIFPIALLWKGSGELPDLELVDTAGKWSETVFDSPQIPKHDFITLDWRFVIIPRDASDGTAELRLPDGRVLGTYTIESLPALYYPAPPFDTLVEDGSLSEAGGILIGYSISGDMTDRSQPFTLTLVWLGHPADISYTVFVQLVTDDGRVLAQSDSIPANGLRPTTGWRSGEYILDMHQVVFHEDASPGTARLIVGFYNAATGQRVPNARGGDFITLQEGIEVK